jgi:hypothetical protein
MKARWNRLIAIAIVAAILFSIIIANLVTY